MNKYTSRINDHTKVTFDGDIIKITTSDNWYGNEDISMVTIPATNLESLILALKDIRDVKTKEW